MLPLSILVAEYPPKTSHSYWQQLLIQLAWEKWKPSLNIEAEVRWFKYALHCNRWEKKNITHASDWMINYFAIVNAIGILPPGLNLVLHWVYIGIHQESSRKLRIGLWNLFMAVVKKIHNVLPGVSTLVINPLYSFMFLKDLQ